MRITAINIQSRNNNRVNVFVDEKYSFSLDIYQVSDLGLRVDQEIDEVELNRLNQESSFGKIYARCLEYCLVRPRSEKEVREYLFKKTKPSLSRSGELKPGISIGLIDRTINRLLEKGYIDDLKFAKFWIENRFLSKGISNRKLTAELKSKGVSGDIINNVFSEVSRSDNDEIKKMIAKKRPRYNDEQKLIAYLIRQGFKYDDVKRALDAEDC